MKKRLITTAIALSVAATAHSVPYHYTAGIATQAPVIDGVLDDAVWASAKQTISFVVHNDASQAQVTTTAKLAFDADNLYVAFYAQDPDITASFTEQDDETYEKDDVVEIFIDPQGDGKDYYEIGISPLAYYDVVINSLDPWVSDFDWDIQGLEQAVVVHGTLNDASDIDQGYAAEIKIPLASLNYTGVNEGAIADTWRVNLHRADYSTGAGSWETNEWLAWSPIGEFGFHKPAKFGYLHRSNAELFRADSVYRSNETAHYQGVDYVAHYYSTNAPGQSSTDGWRATSVAPFNPALIYLPGDKAQRDGQVYQANWYTQGQDPLTSVDWQLVAR